MMGGGAAIKHHNTSVGSKPTSQLKRLTELENRQKIFEDEIIKRIKEIQKYTKSIH